MFLSLMKPLSTWRTASQDLQEDSTKTSIFLVSLGTSAKLFTFMFSKFMLLVFVDTSITFHPEDSCPLDDNSSISPFSRPQTIVTHFCTTCIRLAHHWVRSNE